jgi:hypothetical protein
MVRAAVTGRRVTVYREYDFRLDLRGAGHRRYEIVYFEPEKNAVPIGLDVWITDSSVVVIEFEAVQLQHKHAVGNEALIFRAAMGTLAGE